MAPLRFSRAHNRALCFATHKHRGHSCAVRPAHVPASTSEAGCAPCNLRFGFDNGESISASSQLATIGASVILGERVRHRLTQINEP